MIGPCAFGQPGPATGNPGKVPLLLPPVPNGETAPLSQAKDDRYEVKQDDRWQNGLSSAPNSNSRASHLAPQSRE